MVRTGYVPMKIPQPEDEKVSGGNNTFLVTGLQWQNERNSWKAYAQCLLERFLHFQTEGNPVWDWKVQRAVTRE